jgi:hypothetical protein
MLFGFVAGLLPTAHCTPHSGSLYSNLTDPASRSSSIYDPLRIQRCRGVLFSPIKISLAYSLSVRQDLFFGRWSESRSGRGFPRCVEQYTPYIFPQTIPGGSAFPVEGFPRSRLLASPDMGTHEKGPARSARRWLGQSCQQRHYGANPPAVPVKPPTLRPPRRGPYRLSLAREPLTPRAGIAGAERRHGERGAADRAGCQNVV